MFTLVTCVLITTCKFVLSKTGFMYADEVEALTPSFIIDWDLQNPERRMKKNVAEQI